jgi:glycosyltransferase involved in cell wall biosynthesis
MWHASMLMGLRIALTHAFCWPEVRRGGERYLHELAAALGRRGNDVTILAGARRPKLTSSDGVRLVTIPRGRPDDVWLAERRFGMRLYPALLAGRYDVVHSLGVRDAAASLRALRAHPRRRTVYTCLGIPEAWFQDSMPTADDHRRVVDGVGVYGCLSAFAQRRLVEGYGRAGALTPGGVNTAHFRPTVDRAPTPTLLYSGVIDESRKGVAELLTAVAVLSRTEPNVRLWLSGPGDASRLLANAPAAARERTEVLPLGTLDDQPARYSAAWATVLPSRHEAFGLVLIESLSCGTPIVATEHASLPELVEPQTGVVARTGEPPGDTDALADACARALALASEDSIRERCRAHATPYDWDGGIAPKAEALYLGAERDAPRSS